MVSIYASYSLEIYLGNFRVKPPSLMYISEISKESNFNIPANKLSKKFRKNSLGFSKLIRTLQDFQLQQIVRLTK